MPPKSKKGKGAVPHPDQKPGFLLETSDIDNYLKSRDPSFVGTFSKGQIPKIMNKMQSMGKSSAVINLDDNAGSHWVALIFQDGKWYWLDPLGSVPPKIAINRLSPLVYSDEIYQDASGAECGLYAIKFILDWNKTH